MVIVGAHYLPFIFLYGMWPFAVLAAAMVSGGLALGLYAPPEQITVGAWATGGVLIAFAFWGRAFVRGEQRALASG
jgi:hypothetical protein